MSSRLLKLRRSARRGNTFLFTLVALAVVGAASFAGWWLLGRGRGDEALDLITTTVSRGPYEFVVIEQGTVESGTNVELRCEVRSRGGGGTGTSTTIIDVVPEGTMVQPGDVVVRLDSSALEQERNAQLITVASRKALVAQAENTLAAAKIAREEYLNGTFVQEEKLVEGEVFVASQALATAQNQLNSAKALAAKAIVTALQVETAQFNLDNARKQLEMAQTKLEALRKYTKEKMLKEFDSNIATAEANLAAQRNSLALEEEKLREIEDQIEKCTIRAPTAGQVVYANQYDSWRGSSSAEFIVAPGVAVRERQVIVRLPNAQDMQVKATVNEARVTLVRPGLPVKIRVDALKDELLDGVVTKVNQYAEPSSFSSGSIKRYATFVKILNPPEGLRSGMNAEVRIYVDRKPEALQVPVQALAEHKGHFFTLVRSGDRYETREVKISSTNDKVATIESGLKEGDEVVMNPRAAAGLLVLPDLPDPTPAQIAELQRVMGVPVARNGAGSEGAAAAGPEGGRPGEGTPGARGGKKGFSPAMLVERALEEGDTDKDGKLSQAELSGLDDRRRQMLEGADTNRDGFLDRAEMLSAANAFAQRMREKGGGGRGGRGGEEGPPASFGPAGGGE
jgi:multidrug efflux pump subunit AcrA (membrane-fusion protein)